MSSRFVAQPDVLRAEGNSILGKSEEFVKNVDEIYSTINEMLQSSYMSPAAAAIAKDIETYKEDLQKMARTINNYGNYCVKSANTINRNEENILDRVSGGSMM